MSGEPDNQKYFHFHFAHKSLSHITQQTVLTQNKDNLLIPNIFQTKLTKDQLEVRFKFIQVFSSVNIEKVFFIQEFLSSYPSVISNQRKNNIKKYFIQLVHLFKEQDFIEDNYKIISNGHYYFTKEFNTHDISEGFVIYEKLSI